MAAVGTRRRARGGRRRSRARTPRRSAGAARAAGTPPMRPVAARPSDLPGTGVIDALVCW